MTELQTESQLPTPDIQRVRHELRQRDLTVSSVSYITPKMLRITLTGDDLSDFVSASPDDHIKIFLNADAEKREMRDYTPRRYDPASNSLIVDFAVHDAGPATKWALNAKVGDKLLIGGPRGSVVISGVERWILVGDEAALPAIGRRIEEGKAGTTIISIVAVDGPQEEQTFHTHANVETRWVHRPLSKAVDASGLIAELESIDLAPGTFVWVAAEASVARAIKTYLVETRGHPLGWSKASGYWIQGKSDFHEEF